MSFAEIFMLALVLSVDACIVSFSYGITPLEYPNKERNKLALSTGLFQAFMPVAGYYFTSIIFNYIFPYSKYIVLVIFTLLGLKFYKEAFSSNKKTNNNMCISTLCIILIGIGTSIDAFSGGISLKLSGNTIFKPALLIGIITYINSVVGFTIGRQAKNLPVKMLEIISGTILILMGIKIFL